MSNRKKDGDFNLDQELLSKRAAIESGEPLSDDHEDEKIIEDNVKEISDLVEQKHLGKASQENDDNQQVYYKKHPALKQAKFQLKKELDSLNAKFKSEIAALDKKDSAYAEQVSRIKQAHDKEVNKTIQESLYTKKLEAVELAKKDLAKELKELSKKQADELATLDKSNGNYKEEVNNIKQKYLDLVFDAKAKFKQARDNEFDGDISSQSFEQKYGIHPKLKRRQELINSDILLSVRNLKQFFFFGGGFNRTKLKAVSNISFDVHNGECFGIVGESGCGKTTTGRSIIKLYEITSGSVYYKGYRISAGNRWNRKEIKFTKIRLKQQLKDLTAKRNEEIAALDKTVSDYQSKVNEITVKYNEQKVAATQKAKEICALQREKIKQIKFDNKHTPRKLVNEIQMIFQDPVDSLDPRMTVEDIIQEGLKIQGFKNKAENHKRVVEMLESVGLVAEHASRYPHEFSGGQRQRIGIARALIMNPKLLICDEPISALDVSIRAQIINLLNELKEKLGLTMIFIAHDLSVVKYFCDRIAVMYYGKIVELASSDELFKNPLHPYTKSLLSAIPKPNPIIERQRERIIYNPNTAHDYSVDKPSLKEIKPGHLIYCNEKEFEEYKKVLK